MNSQREKWIAITAAAVVGIFLLDWVFLSPLLASRDALAAKRESLQKQVDDGLRILNRSRHDSRDFRQHHAAGMTGDASATESRLLNELRTWSQETGLMLASVRPDRASATGGLHEIAFAASLNGPMRSLAGFLYRLQNTDEALRVRELQVTARNEGKDELSVELRVSTLWEPHSPVSPATKAASLAERGEP